MSASKKIPENSSYIVNQVVSPNKIELYSASEPESKFVVSLHGVQAPKNGQQAMQQAIATLLPPKKTVQVAFSGEVDESGVFVAEVVAELIDGVININQRFCGQPKLYQAMPPRPIPVVVVPPAPKPVLAPKPPAPVPVPAPVVAPVAVVEEKKEDVDM